MDQIQTEPNIGKRIIAGLVDYVIIYAFLFIVAYAIGEPTEDGYQLNGLKAFIPVIFWTIMTVGLEQAFGATLGNSLVGLKPISILEKDDGQTFKTNNSKPTFGQSFKRHLLDPIDMLFFGIIGIITIKNSEKNQRLGDQWAKTIVVEIAYEKATAE